MPSKSLTGEAMVGVLSRTRPLPETALYITRDLTALKHGEVQPAAAVQLWNGNQGGGSMRRNLDENSECVPASYCYRPRLACNSSTGNHHDASCAGDRAGHCIGSMSSLQ